VETVGLADVRFLCLLSRNLQALIPDVFAMQVFDGAPNASIRLKVTKRESGKVLWIDTRHTMSSDQLKWLRAGSALNHIRQATTAS
jgi:hypothetical protein